MSIMNAAVSGMQADTNWLSTISQNVSNANTTGYKNVETEFSTLVDQVNGQLNVTGVSASVRSLNALQGAVVGTSTVTDLSVQGSGFFIVSDASGALFLTRNGSFVPDASGNLVNAAGYYLMAYDAASGASQPVNALTGLQKVNVNSAGQSAAPTTSGTFTANLPANAATVATANLPSTNTAGSSYTEMSTMVAYDNLGSAHDLNVYFSNLGNNTWQVDVFDATKGSGFPYASGPLATQTLTFSAQNGGLTSGSPLSFALPGGSNVSLDMSGMTQLASAYSVSAASVNGSAPSPSTGLTISSDGVVSFQYANGAVTAAYRVPLGIVASPENMNAVNGDTFQTTAASGSAQVKQANSGGAGSIVASSLENSTVDLATELTNMIEAQSAYQANSKVFQTGATLLDVLNNLKP